MLLFLFPQRFYYNNNPGLAYTRLRQEHLSLLHFYRAMHFSAQRGIAIACRLSVCPSVCNVGLL